MQNVTVKINFSLEDEAGNSLHTTALEYKGMSEERVLFLEKYMIDALGGLNAAATAMLASGKGKKG